MERIKEMPVVGQVLTVLDTYPRLSMWVILSAGIIALLVFEARDVGLSAGNWVALIIASIVVAGLCIWIVSWEDEEEQAEAVVVKSEAPAQETTADSADTESMDTSDAADATPDDEDTGDSESE